MTPQLVRSREIIRGVHVKEQQVRVCQGAHLVQRKGTDADSVVEADSPEVAVVEAIGDCLAAGRTIGSTEWLYASPSAAFRKHSIMMIEACGEGTDEGFRNERHVPGDANDWCRSLNNRGVDAAERSEAGPGVANCPEIRPPGRCIRGVRHEQRRLPQRLGHHPHQPVEDAFPADEL